MKYPKFKLNTDWTYETDFLGTKTTKILYIKDHIFEANDDGKYEVINPTGEISFLTDIRNIKINNEIIFDEVLEVKEFEILIEELPDDDDTLVQSWRIQLDVKTTKSKLKEVQRIIEEHVRPIL